MSLGLDRTSASIELVDRMTADLAAALKKRPNLAVGIVQDDKKRHSWGLGGAMAVVAIRASRTRTSAVFSPITLVCARFRLGACATIRGSARTAPAGKLATPNPVDRGARALHSAAVAYLLHSTDMPVPLSEKAPGLALPVFWSKRLSGTLRKSDAPSGISSIGNVTRAQGARQSGNQAYRPARTRP